MKLTYSILALTLSHAYAQEGTSILKGAVVDGTWTDVIPDDNYGVRSVGIKAMPFDYAIPSEDPRPENKVVDIQFVNQSGETVQVYWHDWSGVLMPYGTMANGGAFTQSTYVISVWSPHPPGQPDAEGFLINGSEVWKVPYDQ